jgi:hypothetical protein
MIRLVEFLRFRGFARLRVELLPHAYIVGPNSAGKSTVLEAIALAEQCLRIARRKLATIRVADRRQTWKAYPLPSDSNDGDDPVRYDFGKEETRVSVQWTNGARVNIVWPEEIDGDEVGFFYLEQDNGRQPESTQATRALFVPVIIVPLITPLEKFEEIKTAVYIEAHQTTRLASRHFRNNMFLMKKSGEYEGFKEFCQIWLPEVKLLEVALNASANRLVVFYADAGSRTPKELSWAGDGIQIWVQLLWHLYRARGATTIVLDEPEVYLHPDIQRRLVRLLDGLNAQIVLASHSADVIAEAPPDGVLWVDRKSGGARRAKSQRVLSDLSASLGSSFNLALARSMRSRLIIASDCQDPRVIRILAKHIGAAHIADEHTVSIIQLRKPGQFTNGQCLGTSLRSVLPNSLPAVLLLQSGYRPSFHNIKIAASLIAPDVTTCFLPGPEIENYLLDPETIAKASGASTETVAIRLAEIHEGLRERTRGAFITANVECAPEGRAVDALVEAESNFDNTWALRETRKKLIRGMDVIEALNVWLERDGYRIVSGYSLARAIKPQAIASEILHVLLGIEDKIS